MRKYFFPAAFCVLAPLTVSSLAATVTTTYDANPYALSATDLFQSPGVITGWDQSSASYGSGLPTSGTLNPPAGPASGYVAAMFDGLMGTSASNDVEGGGQLLGAGEGLSYAATNYHYLRLTLDQPYDLTSIEVFTWSGDFRVEQNFKVFYQAGSPAWVEMATAGNFTDDMVADFGNFYGKTSITDLGVSGITALEFRFFSLRESVGQWARYREIDVQGAPVPEPSALALMVLGSLLTLKRRR